MPPPDTGDQVVDQDPDAAAGTRPEFGKPLPQIVESFEMFDDNTFDAKIVTPHPLDEGSIVYSLHPDPAGQCRAGA